ncbi:hypothetical protein OSB04_017453 [Centaurea solstitialis]|uniref:Reverse transcriptase Ty1/copia-type domain-containing protein n=1 Tax=Centaurea solstitialis TaxID=347529 RepID=A0AA38T2X5_9ASTR|nr:hypothetical protein OSB04_017453 [Centaurea solstitialis]
MSKVRSLSPMVFNANVQRVQRTYKGGPRKDRPLCTHCKFQGHTIEKCYKLHGYPPGFKSKQGNYSVSVNTVKVSSHENINNVMQKISDDQCQYLMSVLSNRLCTSFPSSSGVEGDSVIQSHVYVVLWSNVPIEMWTNCLMMATYLINRTPSKVLGNLSPHAKLYDKLPDYDMLKAFGCLAFASTDSSHRTKFSPRATPCAATTTSAPTLNASLNGEFVHSDNHDEMQGDLPNLAQEVQPPARKSIRIKYGVDGQIERHKARLVAKGFSQQEGADFIDTFSSVAKLVTVKTLLAVAAVKSWDLAQLDVNNAFLNGELNEEVCMSIPPGYQIQGNFAPHEVPVCKLNKSLYGLGQSSRQWYTRFSEFLIHVGFKQSYSDYSMFYKGQGKNYVVVLVYVDDIIVSGPSSSVVADVKQQLGNTFKLKDLGPLKFFLGLEIARSKASIFVSQRNYTLQLLEETGLLAAKSTITPMDPMNVNMPALDGNPLQDPSSYRHLIGRLMYLTITRPGICFAVHKLAQHMAKPRSAHMSAAMHLVKYLKNEPRQGIFFEFTPGLVEPFAESERVIRKKNKKKNKKKSKAGKVLPSTLNFNMGGEQPMWTARRTAPAVATRPITKPNLFKEIKGQFIHMIKELTFDGRSDSNPIVHVESFIDICDLFKTENTVDDAIRLRLFPFTLVGEAKAWLRSLEPSSIAT